jgi:hypothetical protein
MAALVISKSIFIILFEKIILFNIAAYSEKIRNESFISINTLPNLVVTPNEHQKKSKNNLMKFDVFNFI